MRPTCFFPKRSKRLIRSPPRSICRVFVSVVRSEMYMKDVVEGRWESSKKFESSQRQQPQIRNFIMSIIGGTLNIGILLTRDFQLLDAVGPMDFLASHSYEMLSLFPNIPKSTVDKAPSIKWHYISHDRTPIQASTGPPFTPSCTYESAPHLDYIIIPGSDPANPLPEGCTEFLKTRLETQFKAILTVCTGSMIIASTGILDGLQVCSNKVVLKMYAEGGLLNRKIKWVGDRRWIIDGKIWSGAGVTAGIDLIAEFARVHFDPEIVELAKALAEYTPRPDQPDEWAKILDGVKLD